VRTGSKVILIVVLIALIPAIVKLQMVIDPQRRQFQPGKGISSVMTEVGSNPVILPSQFVAGTVIGFREVVAGLLWIRANDFFHSGNYDAIIPLTRIITWLDPHQIDVYRVGAWHLAYNFVDSKSRADYRLIVPAVKFLEEGIANNRDVWDLEFDLGFVIYYLKAQRFDEAIYWIKRTIGREDVEYYVPRQLAHAYEKKGQIDKCIKQWEWCIAQAGREIKKDPKNRRAQYHLTISKINLNLMRVRKEMRADVAKRPVDAGFEAEFKRLGPRVFQISGKANLPDGCRIDTTLMDDDYKEPNPKTFDWQVDPDVTALVQIGLAGIYVADGKFQQTFDLTKDTKQYPLKKDKYVLTLTFNPRTAPDDAQDLIGWSGEGLKDKKYLDTSVPGVCRLRKVWILDREDLI